MNSIKEHRLVGGTALALQIGHRNSVDIDLFSDKKNNYDSILTELSLLGDKIFKKGWHINSPLGNGITVFICDIKTDILDWKSAFIRPIVVDEKIRMAHKEDIIPMKFNAFLCPPEYARYEKKDFTDIAYLLKEYSLEEMIAMYKEKSPNELMADRLIIEGLQLHELADKKPMPKMFSNITWKDIKVQIDKAVADYNAKRLND